MDILLIRYEGHGNYIRGSGENNPQNLLALTFLHKDKNPPLYDRNLKYYASQVSWPGT